MNQPLKPARNPLTVLLSATLLLLVFQALLSASLIIGYVVEGRMHFLLENPENTPLQFSNHRIPAWTGLFLLLVGLPLAGLTIRFMTRSRPQRFYFLQDGWMRCLLGFCAGVALPVAIVGALLVTGYARITAFPGRLSPRELVASILGFGLIMILIGLSEEFVFRGVLTCEWAYRWKSWVPAVTLSGILFGMIHTLNIDATIIEKYRIILSGLVFSWFLSAIMLASRSLKMAIGVHAGWNYGLGCLMGCDVSGQPLNLTVFSTVLTGPPWLVGDRFGLETSSVLNVLLLLITFVIWFGMDKIRRYPVLLYESAVFNHEMSEKRPEETPP